MAPAAKAMASLREDSALAETSTGCLAGLGTLALRAWTCEFAHETIIAIYKGSRSTQETRAESVALGLEGLPEGPGRGLKMPGRSWWLL